MRTHLLIAASATLAALHTTTHAGEKIHVGQSWPAEQRISMDDVDHAVWDELLRKFVDEQGYVDYASWHRSKPDRAALDAYLKSLSQADPNFQASREAVLAFWINAYNAVTVEGILREYPTDSIRNHTAKLFGYNIWHDLLLTVGDNPVSLDSIEHKILRPMGEPRIHFAIVCASIGCPRLLNEAYVPSNVDEQLTNNTLNFFADGNKFQFDARRRQFVFSDILDWFKEDFGANTAERLRWIAPYLPNPAAEQAAAAGQGTVRYFNNYDWGLNDQAERTN